jgi:protein-S-isoprenylcysteine O-methyltransferase Ste14
MKRTLIFVYGVVSYAIFFTSFLYAIGFIGNFLVPTALDGPATKSFTQAALTNLGLLTLFALPHSIMARPAFKRWWTRYVPAAAERSTYVLQSSILLFAVMFFWQPMGGSIWNIESAIGCYVLHGVFAMGWVLVLISTFATSHFDLFGLRQVWMNLIGREYKPLEFVTPWLYRKVRHPLYLGWLLVFWATPTMTTAHLLFAVVTTLYILIAIRLEEHDLVEEHGEDYVAYRNEVPMIVPKVGRA